MIVPHPTSFQIALMITGLPPVLPHVKAGKLRILGVASSQRLKGFPDIPTIAESGVKGYELTFWFAAYTPARTPPAVVTRLGELQIPRHCGEPMLVVDRSMDPPEP